MKKGCRGSHTAQRWQAALLRKAGASHNATQHCREEDRNTKVAAAPLANLHDMLAQHVPPHHQQVATHFNSFAIKQT